MIKLTKFKSLKPTKKLPLKGKKQSLITVENPKGDNQTESKILNALESFPLNQIKKDCLKANNENLNKNHLNFISEPLKLDQETIITIISSEIK